MTTIFGHHQPKEGTEHIVRLPLLDSPTIQRHSRTQRCWEPRKVLLILLSAPVLIYLTLLTIVKFAPVLWVFPPNPSEDRPIFFNGTNLDVHTAKYVLLDTLFKQFDKYQIQAFLVDGVLLGYYRWGGVQPWDHDFEMRFVDRASAMLYWEHRAEIIAALGSTYATRHSQPSLGHSVYPKVEYPTCKGVNSEPSWNATCAADPLANRQGVLRKLYPDVVSTCGVNIAGCSFNEIGMDKFTTDCNPEDPDDPVLACTPLRRVVLRGTLPMQVASVNLPADLPGFISKYKGGLWRCRADVNQCSTLGGCRTGWLALLHMILEKDMDCRLVEVCCWFLHKVHSVHLTTFFAQAAYGGLTHKDATPGYLLPELKDFHT